MFESILSKWGSDEVNLWTLILTSGTLPTFPSNFFSSVSLIDFCDALVVRVGVKVGIGDSSNFVKSFRYSISFLLRFFSLTDVIFDRLSIEFYIINFYVPYAEDGGG